MSRTVASPGKTYLPDAESRQQVADIIEELERDLRAGRSARLVSADDQEIELPGELFDILRQVAEVLASGRGVTVVPRDTTLTTQEAADFVGVSRPTLVKYLEQGTVPFELVGRHRRILLQDLIAFQDRSRAERQALLRQLARANQESGMLEVVYEPERPDA